MLTEEFDATVSAVTVNVAAACPADTVTVDGTVATFALPVRSVTIAPPDGAAPESVTVACELWALDTTSGESESALMVTPAGRTHTVAVCVTPPEFAEIAAQSTDATGCVVMGNAAVVCPSSTVTLGGTVATAVLLLTRLTTVPPAGAGAESTTAPVAL